MIVSGLVKSSLIDYPGHIAAVLFTPGCDFDCFYCHNRPLLESLEPVIEFEEVLAFLEKRKGLLDGVVFTGGEPTLYPDLSQYMKTIQCMGYFVKLDTNGHHPEVVKQLISDGVLDYIAIDYKAPEYLYSQITGVHANPKKVQETIQIVHESSIPYEVRTTVVPQLSLADLIQIALELPILKRYCLNSYRLPKHYKASHKEWLEVPPYSEQQIQAFREEIVFYQPNTLLK